MPAMGVLVFLLSFAGYAWTAYPSLTAQDAGELMVGPATLSIVHPPGYPLYALLGHVWVTLLPLGSVAFRVNLFSCVMTSVALLGVYVLLKTWLSKPSAAFVALAIGGIGPIWAQAVITEVYALNLAGFVWLLVGLQRWTDHQDGAARWWVLAGLGISLANHHLMMLWLPVVGILILRTPWRTWGWSGLTLCLGLALYLPLMLISLGHPPMDWGNPETWEGLWNHLLRRQYGEISSTQRTWTGFWKQAAFAGEMLYEGWSVLLAAAVGGWMWLMKRSKGFGWTALGIFLLMSLGIAMLTNFRPVPMQIHQVRAFFTPAILMAGLALGWCLVPLELKMGKVLAPVLVGIGTLAYGAREWPSHDHQREHIVRQYGLDLLACLPPGAIASVTGDFPTFPLGYLVHVEGRGDTLQFGDEVGAVFPRLVLTPPTIRSISDPLYTSMSAAVLHDRLHDYVPEGLVYRIVPLGTRETPRVGADLWRRLSFGAPLGRNPDPGTFTRYLRQQYYAFGLAEWTWATGNHTLAWERYEKIIRDPMAGETLMQTIGTQLERRGALAQAEACFSAAADKATWTAQPLLAAARTASAQQAPERAEGYFRAALKRDPEAPAVHFQWANHLSHQRRPQEAIAAYREALRWDPGFLAARKNLGALYLDLGDHTRAIEETQAALKLNPNDYQLHANLGAMYHAVGDRARAVEAWQKALALNPRDPQLQALIQRFRSAP